MSSLTLRDDLPAPRVTRESEVLVRVVATTVDVADLRILRRKLLLTTTGREADEGEEMGVLLGRELVGVVVEVGNAVNHLSVGDKVLE